MFGKLVHRLDRWLAKPYLNLLGERGGLLVLYLHHLFLNEAEMEQGTVDPQQRMTVEDFRRLFEYLLRHGYVFVGPDDVIRGLQPGKRYAMMTFDDGYYNNVRALPVLEEFRAPALFFIATGHVATNKPFWNDVLYREGIRRGMPVQEAWELGRRFMASPSEHADRELERRFGSKSRETVGELDRPLTPAELRDFARHKLVFLGNHTQNHAGLPAYDAAGQRAEIEGAQAMLREWTGRVPETIGYPYGLWDASVVESARRVGLRLGFTAVPEKLYPPVGTPDQYLSIGRFLPYPGSAAERDLDYFRSDLLLLRRLQRVRDRWRSRRV